MDKKDIEKNHHQTFEEIKQANLNENEFWMARQLSKILEYAEFRNFLPVIEKAKKACENSGQKVVDHFVEMHEMIELKKSQQILDNMGSTELAANLFRATQAEEKLRRENIQGKTNANNTHFEVGKKVRKTIKDLGGTMPEELPIPEEDLKKLARRVNSAEKKMIKDSGLPGQLEGGE